MAKTHLFPQLGVLRSLTDLCRAGVGSGFEHAVFVCVQHALETTGSLVEAMIQLGARPEAIHLLGKCYSTSDAVVDGLVSLGISCNGGSSPQALGEHEAAAIRDVQKLWERVLRSGQCDRGGRLIVLDDGGRCLSTIPATVRRAMSVIGAEQTTSGIRLSDQIHCPTIEVAKCAAKRLIEPRMIAGAIFQKVEEMADLQMLPRRCGVVGFGSIGRAVAVALAQMKHVVYVCDPDFVSDALPSEMRYAGSVREVIEESDCIFGCTGNDITQTEGLFQGVAGQKLFISCSSGDQEFRTLLRQIHKATNDPTMDPMGSVTYCCDGGELELRILRGGFPINFDGSGESVRAIDIQLTRGLLLGAVIQAVLQDADADGEAPSRLMLHPAIQRYVVDHWRNERQLGRSDHPYLNRFSDIAWIAEQSHGKAVCSAALPALFDCNAS